MSSMRRKKFIDISLFFVAVSLVGLTSAAPNKLKIFQNENLKNKLSDVEVKNIGEDDIQVYEQDKVKHVVVRIDSSENTYPTSTETAEEQATDSEDEGTVVIPIENVKEVTENSDDEDLEDQAPDIIPTETTVETSVPEELEPSEELDSSDTSKETDIESEIDVTISDKTVEEENTEREADDIDTDETADVEVVPVIEVSNEDAEVTTQVPVLQTVPDESIEKTEKDLSNTENNDRDSDIEVVTIGTSTESVEPLTPEVVKITTESTVLETEEVTDNPILLVKSGVEEQNSTEVTTQIPAITTIDAVLTTISSEVIVPEIIEVTTSATTTTSTTTTTPVISIETQPVLTTMPPPTTQTTKAPILIRPSSVPKKAKVHHQKAAQSKPVVEEQSTSWFFDADGSWSWFGIIFILLFLVV